MLHRHGRRLIPDSFRARDGPWSVHIEWLRVSSTESASLHVPHRGFLSRKGFGRRPWYLLRCWDGPSSELFTGAGCDNYGATLRIC